MLRSSQNTNSTPLKHRLRHDLHAGCWDGFFFSLMVGMGETFFPAFALALGKSQVIAAMLAALPLLLGGLIQLLAPWAVERIGSPRKWVVVVCGLQTLAFIPLLLGAITGDLSTVAMFAAVTWYWACGLSVSPSWNLWMSCLVPHRARPRFFSSRARFCQLGLVFGLVGGGIALQIAKHNHFELYAFAGLFLLAGLSRLTSSQLLRRQHSGDVHKVRVIRLPLRAAFRSIAHLEIGKLIFIVVFFQMVTGLASPFFTPFMLKQLNLTYLGYMGLTCALLVSKMFMFSLAGEFARKWGPLKVLQLGMTGVAFLPLMWLLSQEYSYLFFTQVVSGAMWACFELGLMLTMVNHMPTPYKLSLLSFYNVISAFCTLVGTGLGSLFLYFYGEEISTYFILFAVSGGLRMVVSFTFRSSDVPDKIRPEPVVEPLLEEPSPVPQIAS